MCIVGCFKLVLGERLEVGSLALFRSGRGTLSIKNEFKENIIF